MKNLVGLDKPELQALAESLGEKPFRGQQLHKWLYEKNARSLDDMTDLPKAFRAKLAEEWQVSALSETTSRTAPDGTTKFLYRGEDGREIESVWIPYPDRVTVCISSQVGCAMACSVCATGQLGFERNLTAGEIVDQVLAMQAKMGRRVTLEYIMLHGVNDLPEHAQQLIKWSRGLHVHINLIPYHPTGVDFKRTPEPEARQFARTLEAAGFPTAIRAERGLEIEAACGQLKRQLAVATGEK
jgi:23S rRNA (adenine2503-C2)-methyltransferase